LPKINVPHWQRFKVKDRKGYSKQMEPKSKQDEL
jgi:hypothetical protein